MNERNKNKRRKNKNRKFLHNAKGFAKEGNFGRGTRIDDDQFTYFINILEAMRQSVEDVEDRVAMANNVFEQTVDQEIHLASNQVVSKVLESLVGFVEPPALERFFRVFSDNFRPICSDSFASHVLQKMVEVAFFRALGKEKLQTFEDPNEEEGEVGIKRAKVDNSNSEEDYNLKTEYTAEHRQECANFVLRVGKFLLNNLEDFVWDRYASHIMRTSILCLAGIHVPKVVQGKPAVDITKNRKIYTVPDEWQEVMKEFPTRLEMWPHFVDFPYSEHSSALLSIICVALKVVDKNMLKHFGKKILMNALLITEKNDDDEGENKIDVHNDEAEKSEDNAERLPELPKVFKYQSSNYLLETLLNVAGKKLFTQLYAMLFAGRCALLAKESLTNFAVQKLLQNIKEKENFESIFTELADHFEEILKLGYTGVIFTLAETCLRLATKQVQMFVALQTALHVVGDKDKLKHFFLCLVKLKPYEITLEDKSSYVNLQGSLIMQCMLKFNKPIVLVNLILETTADQLVNIFNTPNGSHIVDAFLQSKFIGEKSREKLLRHLEGYYIDLALTRFGSRVLDHCFNAAQDAQKQRIAKELSENPNKMKSTPYGRIIFTKYRLDIFQLSPAQWKSGQQKNESKVQKLFKDIIE